MPTRKTIYDKLLDRLLALDGVDQDLRYHPERDALYHSLQVYNLARRASSDRALWAAALLHDVGKAEDPPRHDVIGADMLEGLVAPRIVWLVRHHLCLLREPRTATQRLRNTAALRDLERLRRFDLGGRDPSACVLDPADALSILMDCPETILPDGDPAPDCHDLEDLLHT